MIFKKADLKDKDTITSLYETVKGEEYCTWNEFYPTVEDTDNDLINNNLFVLVENDEIIGAISIVSDNELNEFKCWSSNESVAEFARVVISKEYQNKGYAVYLVSNVLEVLETRGFKNIHISVAKINTPALKTYEKLKFKNVGEAKMFGGDYYLLEKSI